MTMRLPPTRYKVVERGRRLEVIDTWTGGPASPRLADNETPAARGTLAAPSRRPNIDARGRTLLNTRGWYDDKGPRAIALTPEGEAKLNGLRFIAIGALGIAALALIFFWPLLFVAPFLLARSTTRTTLRRGATRFLDTINQPAGAGSSRG